MQLRTTQIDLPEIQRLTCTSKASIDLKDLGLIEKLLRNYKYGKDLDFLLSPIGCFQVVPKEGSLSLTNFINSNRNRGVCGEVSNSLGLRLKNNPDFNSKYDVLVVSGSHATKFPEPSVHAFLLIAPKSANICESLQTSPKEFPEGAVLVDPSLGELAVASEFNNSEDSYKLIGANLPYQEVGDYSGSIQLDLKPDSQNPVIIGFTNDYLPGDFADQEILYLVFKTNQNNQVEDVSLASRHSVTEEVKGIEVDSYSNSSKEVLNLKRLIAKVKSNLSLPESILHTSS